MTTRRRGVVANLLIRASAGADRTQIRVSGAQFPVAVRRTGPTGAHLVGTGAWPLGGDTIELTVVVEAGATFDLTAAAAMVALPGPNATPATVTTRLVVETGASLCFDPGPTVVAAGAILQSHTSLSIAAGGSVLLRDLVLLGRHRETPGTAITRTDLTFADQPILRETLHRPDAGTKVAVDGGMRGIASLLTIGAGPPPENVHAGPGRVDGRRRDDLPQPDAGSRQAAHALPGDVGWRAIAIGCDDGTLTAWSRAWWKVASESRTSHVQKRVQPGSHRSADSTVADTGSAVSPSLRESEVKVVCDGDVRYARNPESLPCAPDPGRTSALTSQGPADTPRLRGEGRPSSNMPGRAQP